MVLTFVNPNLIVLVIMALIAFANPRMTPLTPQSQSVCAQVGSFGVDAQTRSVMTAACVGSDLARVMIANQLMKSQFVFTAVDGRYNVAVGWQMSTDASDPKCNLRDSSPFPTQDSGLTWWLVSQFENPTPDGRYMQVNQRCVLGAVSAAEVLDRVVKRLAEKGLSIDDVDWQTVQRMTEVILREIAESILKRF
jgi:hypothetical protein